MSRLLVDLAPSFQPVAMELLARLTEAGIPVMIVNTRRTPLEQAANLANGVSWIAHSKHLDGLAIDICPYDTFLLHGANKLEWDTKDPVWERIGRIGEALGLGWGGRWKQRDCGHFEQAAAGADKKENNNEA